MYRMSCCYIWRYNILCLRCDPCNVSYMLCAGWGSNKKKSLLYGGGGGDLDIGDLEIWNETININDAHTFLIKYAGKSKAKFISKNSVVTRRVL